MAGDAHGAPSPGLRRGNLLGRNPGGIRLIGLQQAHQRVQVGGQKIFAPDVQDDALADLVTLAVAFHQAEIFVAAVGGFDGAEEHGDLLLHYEYSTERAEKQEKYVLNAEKVCHYTFSKTENRPCAFSGLQTEGLKKTQTCARVNAVHLFT